jgi:hypothetical protein
MNETDWKYTLRLVALVGILLLAFYLKNLWVLLALVCVF